MSKRKTVYGVTLHEEVAEWLRQLGDKGSLSGGIAAAQALLALPGVMRVARAAETAEKERVYEGAMRRYHEQYGPRPRSPQAAPTVEINSEQELPKLPADGSDVFDPPVPPAPPKPLTPEQQAEIDAINAEAEASARPGEPTLDVCRNCLVVLEVTDPLPATCPHCQVVDPLDARLGSATRGPGAASTADVDQAAAEGSTPPVPLGEPQF